ncbi:glycoside hydrolase family 5 protein [Pseudocercospora fijiensis CIRAD86]|uniref:mannan endo-1,4-beta-mannosidase n=1 Tax=Pseudocercospora fijiensis (strain CIRAD86) TaxID=383855 RepID=M3A429_PSEFD|nr:glycoside hydrolase family 5 protein [Pseudocercospora fijiensis CIRAD86]EME85864.1 glycoside hydrolase family 5 protein [Pseudocercospora fijiensis CIRAD86]
MPPKPHTFVCTKGTKFQLNGEDFYFAGSNAYYFSFSQNRSDIEVGFRAAKEAGLKVIRTWGFNDKNSTYQPNGFPKYGGEGAGETEIVFQRWQGGKSVIDLQPFDDVVSAALANDIKLIVALTNNWADYGGMDVYTVNLGGPDPYHDDFYRVPAIKDAFKRYIKAMVSRYKNSPAIMAWELANEPRCGGDPTRNLPRSPANDTNTGGCTPGLLTAWKDEMSTYIKSLDPNHLVTTGSEGQYTRFDPDDVFYNGTDGGDFLAELSLPNVDFGTFHSYPDWWSKSVEWTVQWIKNHAETGETAQKPVVHEEYGWLNAADRLKIFKKTTAANETRLAVMKLWQATTLELKVSDMYWQFGYSNYSYGRNHDDGFTIYLDDAEAQDLVFQHAAQVNALNAGYNKQ